MTIYPDNNPSLIAAVQKGDVATVRAQLAVGVDPDTVDVNSRSALYHAASIGHTDIVNLLLEKNADANFEDDDGATPFIAALEGKHFNVAARLLEAGADINMVSGQQRQPVLHWAFNMDIRDEKNSRVLWLIEKGADFNRENGNRETIMARARVYEKKWAFAGELLTHIEELIKSRDPAVIAARQMEAAKQEMCEAIHGGLRGAISVRPIKLVPPPKPF